MVKLSKDHSCSFPRWGRKEGKYYQCPVCHARYRFLVSKGTDRYGRPIKGHGSWVQVGG